MTLILNYILLFCGTVSLVAGIFYFMYEHNHTFLNVLFYLLGIFCFLWCAGYAMVGFSSTYHWAFIGRIAGFLGIVCFLDTMVLILTEITHRYRKSRIAVMIFLTILSIVDILTYLQPAGMEFVIHKNITLIHNSPSWLSLPHAVFIATVVFLAMFYAVIWIKDSHFRRENRIMVTLIMVYCVILIGAIPDTLFPVFGFVTIPTSGFFAFLSYMALLVAASKYNIFAISEQNLNSYIFNYAHSPIMVFDAKEELAMLNHYGKTFLNITKTNHQKMSDIFEIREEVVHEILQGLNREHLSKTMRLVTKEDHTICVVTLSAVLDMYDEPYCTVCFAYDLSKEASMLREVNTMKSQLENALEEKRQEIENLTLQSITTIANTIDAKDTYTKGHSLRVAQYSALLAESLGWEDKDVQNLRYTALLHDIGKIGIPDVILKKPGELSDAEFSMIQSHTTTGGDILKDILMIPDVAFGAMYHHERYDGTGYPSGLKEEEIPIVARIICIADAYDAMNSNRIYRNALPKEVIRKELEKGRNTQFDPVLLDHFLSLLDKDLLVVREYSSPENNSSTESVSLASETTNLLVKLVHNLEKETQNKDTRDYLTGLLSRMEGEKQIQEAMRNNPGCLAFIDLDNLKHVNDTMGHAAGDSALKMVSDIMKEHAHTAIISRIGGDEFLFYMPEADKNTASEIINGIIASYESRKDTDPALHSTSISAGLCLCTPADTFTEVFQKADKAVYHVKQNGKGGLYFYPDNSFEIKHISSVDLNQLISNIQKTGDYKGALNAEYRQFTQIFGFLVNLSGRFDHGMQLVMITLDGSDAEGYTVDEQEKAMLLLESTILSALRNIDICTRFSSTQFLIILLNANPDSIDLIIHRIFESFSKQYPRKDLVLSYDAKQLTKSEN